MVANHSNPWPRKGITLHIFNAEGLHDLYKYKRQTIDTEIEALTDDQLTSGGLDQIVGEILERHHEQCPEVLKGSHWAEKMESERYSEEVTFELHIPFEGEGRVFGWYDRTRPMVEDKYSVNENTLIVRLRVNRSKVETLDEKVEKKLEFIEEYLQPLREMIPRHNASLKKAVEEALRRRNAELEKKQTLEKKMAGLSVPIRRRDEHIVETIVPMKRKVLKPKPVTLSTFSPERHWAIEQQMYEDILKSMESMVKVMERTPSTFCSMGEEALRDILLVNLNGVYEGAATSETFNGVGKTDILLRWEDNNVFIAECLIWNGPEYLRQKMNDQLFKYATWRDSRLALIVFSKNVEFTNVISSMRETVGAHPQCVRADSSYTHGSGARYVFHRRDDPQRQFQLTSLAFHVPQKAQP